MFLLDTNVCIEFLRGRNAGVMAQMQLHQRTDLRICSIVLSELLFGALRSAKPAENLSRVADLAAEVQSLPFDDHAAEAHARVRNDLASGGIPIGPHDSQIAAIALAHGLTLVTHDVAEFQRIAGLVIVDWQT